MPEALTKMLAPVGVMNATVRFFENRPDIVLAARDDAKASKSCASSG